MYAQEEKMSAGGPKKVGRNLKIGSRTLTFFWPVFLEKFCRLLYIALSLCACLKKIWLEDLEHFLQSFSLIHNCCSCWNK